MNQASLIREADKILFSSQLYDDETQTTVALRHAAHQIAYL